MTQKDLASSEIPQIPAGNSPYPILPQPDQLPVRWRHVDAGPPPDGQGVPSGPSDNIERDHVPGGWGEINLPGGGRVAGNDAALSFWRRIQAMTTDTTPPRLSVDDPQRGPTNDAYMRGATPDGERI